MQGICEEAAKKDYDVMLAPIKDMDYSNLERMISNHKVDGVILSRSLIKDPVAEFLKERQIPFVLMGTSKDEEILQVDNNHKDGCCELVKKILEKESFRIGLIGGNRNLVVNRARLQGYEEAFAQEKQKIEETLIYHDCKTFEQMEAATKEILKKGADCIICMDDMICSQVLKILEKEQIKVPEQMKVASFYDSTLLRYYEPTVTSLLFDDKALGALTCQILISYIQGNEVPKRSLLGYEVAFRESTGRIKEIV